MRLSFAACSCKARLCVWHSHRASGARAEARHGDRPWKRGTSARQTSSVDPAGPQPTVSACSVLPQRRRARMNHATKLKVTCAADVDLDATPITPTLVEYEVEGDRPTATLPP